MITLTNISSETRRAVLKVIQGPLAGFKGKSWRMRMELMLEPFFPAWGLVPDSYPVAFRRRKRGDAERLGTSLA